MFETLIVTAPCRVKVSEGEAEFFNPYTQELTDNEFAGNKWIDIRENTEIQMVARYEKTDTYMLAVKMPRVKAGEDGKEVQLETFDVFGMVLRRASMGRVYKNSDVTVEAQEPAAAAEPFQKLAFGA